ncbi:MAG TPA: hypothetical protein VN605_11510, partial [Thermoanaerobaculia bacterium]|nr:hypothetical protein [Thermoanaerobaculia bacterium]
MRSPLAALLLSILISAAATADPQLVKDIRLDGTQSSLPRNFVSDGTTAYFIADDQNPSALWKTDGTPEGTQLLKMTMPPHFESFAYSAPWLTVSGDTVYFFGATELGDIITLFRTDGTPEGTVPLADIGDRFNNQVESVAAVGGGRIAFVVTQSGPDQVWVSDGTPAGTRRLPAPMDASGLLSDGTMAWFTSGASLERALWQTDGRQAGTRSVITIGPSTLLGGIVAGKPFLGTRVGSSGSDLFILDGAALTKIGHVDEGSLSESQSMNGAGGLLFVLSTVTTHALWTTDGTADGTKLLASLPGQIIAGGTVRGISFFATLPQSGARQLWRTDGTPAGTFVLTEDANLIRPVGSGSRHQYFL